MSALLAGGLTSDSSKPVAHPSRLCFDRRAIRLLVAVLLAALLWTVSSSARAFPYAEARWIGDDRFLLADSARASVWSLSGFEAIDTNTLLLGDRNYSISEDGAHYVRRSLQSDEHEIRATADNRMVHAITAFKRTPDERIGEPLLLGRRGRFHLIAEISKGVEIGRHQVAALRLMNVDNGSTADFALPRLESRSPSLSVDSDPSGRRALIRVGGLSALIDLSLPGIISEVNLATGPRGIYQPRAVFSHDGDRVAILDADGLRVIDAGNGQVLASRENRRYFR